MLAVALAHFGGVELREAHPLPVLLLLELEPALSHPSLLKLSARAEVQADAAVSTRAAVSEQALVVLPGDAEGVDVVETSNRREHL